jgi:hypothetical protein
MRDSLYLIVVALVFTLAVSFDSPIKVCRADDGKAFLKIEGQFIHSLTLEDAQGKAIALVASLENRETMFRQSSAAKPPCFSEYILLPAENQTVPLAPDKYRWNSVIVRDRDKDLKFYTQNQIGDWFYLRTGVTKTLSIGAPLRQSLRVSRSGALLSLDYKLLGAGGEEYRPYLSLPSQRSQRPEAPGLSIYKVDEEILADSFQYG